MVKKEKVSKMAIDPKNIKNKTLPNPVVTGGIEEIGLKKISPMLIPKYLLMHPALPRGIEIKANRMVKLVDEDLERNIFVNKSSHEKSEEASEYCKKLLYDSGGPLFIKQMAQGALRFGTSFAVLVTDVAESEVLKFEYQHEIFFGPAKYPMILKGKGAKWGDIPMESRQQYFGKMKIDEKTKKIAKYTQLYKAYPSRTEDNFKFESSEYVNTRTHPGLKNISPGQLVPVGEEIDQASVIQLAFDTIGDEPLGIPLIQFLHRTIDYLLSMEEAGAQTMVNFGFNKWVANTPFKDEKKMRQFGKSISNLQKDSVIILPENIEIKNIEPGTTEFDKVHPIFIKLIATRLGIPISLLLQDGTSVNKATLTEQRKDMNEDSIADELTMERAINEGFFKSCQVKWPDLMIKEIENVVPKFKFKKPPEDLDSEMDRNLKFSLMIRNYATAAKDWTEVGGDEEIIQNIGLKISTLIQSSLSEELLEDNSKKKEKE